VVVKAKPITGQATGSSSAAEVATQIQQCFGAPFQDPTAPTKQDVHRCYVVCPHEIKKEALQTLESVLKASRLDRNVYYLAGEGLWEKVKEHLSERTLVAKASEISDVLKKISDDLHMSVNVTSDQIALGIPPDAPIEFKTLVAFPDDPDGRIAREAFERHIRTGEGVTLRSEYIVEWEVPEPLTRLGLGTPREVKLSPQDSDLGLIKVEMSSHAGTESISRVPFRRRQGTDEMTLWCDDPAVPLEIRLRFIPAQKSVGFAISLRLAGFNVKQQLAAFRFHEALVAGGTLRFEYEATGATLFEHDVESGTAGKSHPHFLRLLEALLTIQSRTSVLLSVPDERLSPEEVNAIAAAHRAVEGQSVRQSVESIELNFSRSGADVILQQHASGEPLTFTVVSDDEVEIFGTRVPLGKVVRHIEGLQFVPGEADHVELAHKCGAESLSARFCAASTGANVIARYLNWLPADEAAQYRGELRLPE